MAQSAPPLGIMMLETNFHRPVGDVRHPRTWPFPVLFATVPGAAPRRVVDGDTVGLLQPFVDAAVELVRQGAAAVITSCGFLATLQAELAARIAVPIATSALLQLPIVARTLPGGSRPGIVTYDAASITSRHLTAVGAAPDTPIVGLPQSGALRGIIERGQVYDRAQLEAEVVAAATGLLRDAPNIGALALECTNLPPFSHTLRQRLGVPVFDVVTLGCWLHAAATHDGFPKGA